MTSIGLNSGLQALLTSQAALDVIGHNLANANTPGYSRQNLSLSTGLQLNMRGLGIGTGVHADVVNRTVDDLVQRRMIGQTSSLSSLTAQLAGMGGIEVLLGEPGGFGLSSGLDNFFSSISSFASSPEDMVLRTGLAQAAGTLTSQFNQLSSNLDSLRQDTGHQINLDVGQVNALAEQLVQLNKQVSEIEATGTPANDLRDRREVVLASLAQYVDVGYTEASNGILRVTVAGRLLVGENRSFDLVADSDRSGHVSLTIQGSDIPFTAVHGSISGLQHLSESFIPGLSTEFDQLAHNMILEFNRVHSTGIPHSGGFQQLTGEHAVLDVDRDGNLQDELLSNSGLPFDVSSGELYVNMNNTVTGELTTHRIEIDAASMTVGELLGELNDIQGLSAELDNFGRLQLLSDTGTTFDFGRRLDVTPDGIGSFGSQRASLGSAGAQPFALADGDTLDFDGPLGPFSVTLSAGDFAEISEATAEEVAEALNDNPAFQASGLRAETVAGRLVVQTESTGATESFDIVGGTATAAFGWAPGTTVTGHDTGVSVELHGGFTGNANDQYTFVPSSDGVIGTTPGLEVSVYDRDGQLVSTLQVGEGYLPGTELEVGNGVGVSFGFGTLSSSNNDVFAADMLADSDTTDVLVALGLNGLFSGTDAATISVRAELESDPSLIAASAFGSSGDNSTLLGLLDLQSVSAGGLEGRTFNQFYGDLIGGIGFDISSTNSTREVEQFLMENLEQRREQVSGVNVDEELVNMIKFEQAFATASRYIQVINDLNQDLLQIL